MFFWNSLAFLMIKQMLAIWSLVPLPFLNPDWTSGSSWFTHLLKPGLENFEHYFASMWNACSSAVVWTLFGIAFLWDWDENWPFPVLWPLLSFPDLLAIECSTFTASSRPIKYHITYMWNLKKWHKLIYLQNRLTDIENKLMFNKEERGRGDKWRI